MSLNLKLGKTSDIQRCVQCARHRTDVLEQAQLDASQCDDLDCSFKLEIEYILQGKFPVIKYFKATPELIKEEEPVTLEWEVENAEIVELSHGIGRVPLDTKTIEFIAPGGDLEIELTVRNNFEVNSKVALQPYPVSISRFKVNKEVALSNQDIQLAWEADGVKQLKINDDIDVTGLQEYNIKLGEYDELFELIAYGHFGVNIAEEYVEVKVATIDFFDHVEEHGNHQLKWETSNISRIEIEKDGQLLARYQGSNCDRGAKQIFASNEDTTYTLKAFTIHNDCTIEAITLKAAVIKYFSANETIVYPSMPVILDWATENAEEVILEPLGISLNSNGSHEINVTEELLEYSLVVKGRINTVQQKIRLKLIEVGNINNLKIELPKITMPQAINLHLKKNQRIDILSIQLSKKKGNTKNNFFRPKIPKIKLLRFTGLFNLNWSRRLNLKELKKIKQINIPSQEKIRDFVSVAEIEKSSKNKRL